MESDDLKEVFKELISEIVNTHPNEYKDAFEILLKLFNNIINHPDEKRYRNFKKSNQTIKTKVLVIPEVVGLLEVLGYSMSSDPELMVYEGDTINNFKQCVEVLNTYLPKEEEEEQPMPKDLSSGKYQKVMVYQYDLSNGMASRLGQQFLRMKLDGIWHTSVVVYGKEYFYGGGIQVGMPKQTPYGKPVKEIDFDYTDKTEEEFKQYLKRIDPEFKQDNYDLLNHNCNHFTDAALYFLVRRHLPDNILKQHNQILNSPIGAMLRPMLESMSRGGNNAAIPNIFERGGNNPSGGYGGNNPYGGFGGYGGGYGDANNPFAGGPGYGGY